MLLFQDDDEEEEEAPLVRKRKQPSASISQPSEGGSSANEVNEDKVEPALKKKKNTETATQGTPKKDQAAKEEKRKKKNNEDPRPKANVREKSAPKRTKVHKALKISSDSGEISKSQDTLATAKDNVIEKDQHMEVAEDNIPGTKDDPKPQSESLIKDQDVINEMKQNGTQKGGDAPNVEKEKDSLTDPEVEAKEVYFALFSNFIFSHYPLVLIDFSLCFTGSVEGESY
jgi:hypothetical protein